MSGKVVLLNKALHGLKQSGRSWYKLLSSTLVECGFEQCLVDLCVFRLMLNNAVVAMLVVHVDDIKIAGTKEVTDSVVADLNKIFLQNIRARFRGTWVASTGGIVRREPWRFRKLS